MPPVGRPSDQEVWAQYARISGNELFRKAPKLQKLLKTLVEFWLAGEGDLDEIKLGEAMSETPVPPHRVNADNHGYPQTRGLLGHVRPRLTEYYEDDGYSDPLVIKINSGYTVVIQYQDPA